MDLLARTIIGNIVINGAVLREFLKKSFYFLTYKPETETIQFNVNHRDGGKLLFEIRNASYENAEKLAKELGLNSDGSLQPLTWKKWNPVLFLRHNGSVEAEQLRMVMLKLNIPFGIQRISDTEEFSLDAFGGRYTPPSWTVEQMLEIIMKEYDRNKDAIETTP